MKTTATIKRANGKIEKVDLSEKFKVMNDVIAKKIKEETAKAGKGEVLAITSTWKNCNLVELEKKYDEVFNEGGEGYTPGIDELKSIFPGQYREWEDRKEWI